MILAADAPTFILAAAAVGLLLGLLAALIT